MSDAFAELVDNQSRKASAWRDALIALALFAVDPGGLGGIRLRAHAGPARAEWLNRLNAMLPDATPVKKLPAGISDARLLGGLDLTSTLATGRPVAEPGLLASADGGIVIAAMAERLTVGNAGVIASALDRGEIRAERDGLTFNARAVFGLVLLDESVDDDEQPPQALIERLAFDLDLSGVTQRDLIEFGCQPGDIVAARARLSTVVIDDSVILAFCETAEALGVGSIRAELLAVRVAKSAAALLGSETVGEAEARIAARLVFTSRATRVPAAPDQTDQPAPSESPQTSPADRPEPDTTSEDESPPDDLADILRAAVSVSLPANLLVRAGAGPGSSRATSDGRKGSMKTSGQRGRITGLKAEVPCSGQRLNVIETLRAAAPWQAIRQTTGQPATPGARQRLLIRASDLRVSRFKSRTRTSIIFAVDASGSQALNRLAEAKGAVELLLAECYVRRDQVAVIAFRGTRADLILPPTHSLTRAKRAMTSLPGGGATPLASGIDAAFLLAAKIRRAGETALIVCLTDGQANVGRTGKGGRAEAEADALAAARAIRISGTASILIDTALRPAKRAKDLADAMGADYVALPQATAAAVSSVLKQVTAALA